MHGELDHAVYETDPFRRRQAIGVEKQPDLLATTDSGRETDPFCDIVVMKLSVQPCGFRQLPQGINWPGEFPVDERERDTALGDDVPRTQIAVTDHRMFAGQAAGERRLPARVRRWLEGFRSFMQAVQEGANSTNGLVIPGPGMRRCPGDIGDRFPAISVEAVTDGTRSALEADRLQMLKKRHYRTAPWSSRTQNHVLAPVGLGCGCAVTPDGKRRFIGIHGHSLPSAIPGRLSPTRCTGRAERILLGTFAVRLPAAAQTSPSRSPRGWPLRCSRSPPRSRAWPP